ncbi:MAG: hypothetical protein QXG97_00125 [Nitrososphaerota archaeon]
MPGERPYVEVTWEKEISDLVKAVESLKIAVNALRNDFRAHDHGATYSAAVVRVNTSTNSIVGTETNTPVVNQVPPAVFRRAMD